MKKTLKVLIALALAAVLAVSAFAYNPEDAETKADALNTLGLFKGTDIGYELEKPLTRLEALIMLIRLSGGETEALYNDELTHPFTDAPDWEGASGYLAYGHTNKLASGISETEFAPQERATLQMYATFALRALGYTDTDEGTVWDNWEKLSAEAGIIPEDVNRENFLRGDAVLISIAALDAKVAGGEGTLAERLSSEYVISDLALSIANAVTGKEITPESPLKDILGYVYAGIKDLYPAGMMTMVLDSENLSFFAGADAEKIGFEEGIACEPMMSSKPHSVSLIRVKEGTDIEAAKKEIRENVDPRKWICVSVSEGNIRVENIGNLILLVMDNTICNEIAGNFRKLDKSLITPDEKGLMVIDGNYIEADEPVKLESLQLFAEKLNTLREKNFPENKVYFATIPEKSYFVRSKTVNYLNHESVSGNLKDMLYDWTHIELGSALTLDDYYNTDRHWRQEKLFPVMEKFAEAMNFTFNKDAYTVKSFENYTGDYKELSAEIPSETLNYLTSDTISGAVVADYNNSNIKTVYNEEKLTSKIPYDVFLSGATPLTVITNPAAKEAKRLIIFRDSYGSSIAPLFIEAYSEITLIDLRYMASTLLPQFVDFKDAEVLFLVSDKVANNPIMLK